MENITPQSLQITKNPGFGLDSVISGMAESGFEHLLSLLSGNSTGSISSNSILGDSECIPSNAEAGKKAIVSGSGKQMNLSRLIQNVDPGVLSSGNRVATKNSFTINKTDQRSVFVASVLSSPLEAIQTFADSASPETSGNNGVGSKKSPAPLQDSGIKKKVSKKSMSGLSENMKKTNLVGRSMGQAQFEAQGTADHQKSKVSLHASSIKMQSMLSRELSSAVTKNPVLTNGSGVDGKAGVNTDAGVRIQNTSFPSDAGPGRVKSPEFHAGSSTISGSSLSATGEKRPTETVSIPWDRMAQSDRQDFESISREVTVSHRRNIPMVNGTILGEDSNENSTSLKSDLQELSLSRLDVTTSNQRSSRTDAIRKTQRIRSGRKFSSKTNVNPVTGLPKSGVKESMGKSLLGPSNRSGEQIGNKKCVTASDHGLHHETVPSISQQKGVDMRSIAAQPAGAGVTVLDREPLIDQITPALTRMVREKESHMKITLRPENLGFLRIELTSDGEAVRVRFFVESGEIKTLVDSSLPDVKEALQKEGVLVEHFQVDIDRGSEHASPYEDRMWKSSTSRQDKKRSVAEKNGKLIESNQRINTRYFGYNSMEISA